MTTGTTDDFAARIRSVLPTGWFPAAPTGGAVEQAPLLAAVLRGCGYGFSVMWDWLTYLVASSRLDTSSGIMIDLWADDFFGYGAFPRLVTDGVTENDADYIARIKSHGLGSQSPVRANIVGAVTVSVGVAPLVVEPQNAADCKGIASMTDAAAGGGYGYGTPGLRFGTMRRSALAFVTTNDPQNVAPPSALMGEIAAMKALGVAVWVRSTDT